MAQLFANNAATTLAASATASATSLSLVSGASFPSPSSGDFFIATISAAGDPTTMEIVKVTARSTNSLTVTRGQEGTSAQAWNAGDNVQLRLTAGALTTQFKQWENWTITYPNTPLNTDLTNSTGYPIIGFGVAFGNTSSQGLSIYLGASTSSYKNVLAALSQQPFTVIIPPGWSYKFVPIGSGGSFGSYYALTFSS
ncbi:MAG TPA: hypothetical protein VKA19_14420 [Alphaproteobacteria bacterium]|nr:hypothetical protein [Alphaproteobacteria bacterium]